MTPEKLSAFCHQTMICSACNASNPADANYCSQCATALQRRCTQCQSALVDGARFCGQCGTPVVRIRSCSACGSPLEDGYRFCAECGTRAPDEPGPASTDEPDQPLTLTPPDPIIKTESPPLPPAPSVPPTSSDIGDEMLASLRAMMPQSFAEKIEAVQNIQGERREVTVLFVKIVNSGMERGRLDSEDLYLLTDEAMRLLVDVIYRYEATVDKFTGDGIMALFGAPVAHENDPERAVRAALEMHQVLRPLNERIREEHAFDLQLRIGINTGIVVAGSLGSDLHMEYTVIGDTVNLAARLEAAAEAGATLTSFTTYQRTRPLFHFVAMPLLKVKGKPDPIQSYRPLSLRETPGRVRGLPGMQVPMVGRTELLEELENTFEEVLSERASRIAMVSGEAGLGKSRLVAEFSRKIAGQPVNVYEGSCLSYARSTPFWLMASLLREVLKVSESEPVAMQQERLAGYLKELGLPQDELEPYLLNILAIPQRTPLIASRLAMMDAAILERQSHVALHQVLRAETRVAPTVLIFEDIHWIDPASRAFLVDFLRTSTDLPIFSVLVSRAYERTTVIADLMAAIDNLPAWQTDIELSNLPRAQELQLIEQLLSQAGIDVDDLATQIADRAEGNPFYIEEIVRMLIDQQLVDSDTPTQESALKAVPGTLKGLILARFDRLAESSRRILQTAAVLGRTFPTALLRELHGESETQLRIQLEELVEKDFLVEEAYDVATGHAFRHALLQDAIYSTLLKRDRRALHDAVAKVLEENNFLVADGLAEALAYHKRNGGRPEAAIPHLIEAAESAFRRSASESAIGFYRRALDLVDSEPEIYSATYCRIHIGLGQALKFVGELDEAHQVLERALEHQRALGSDEAAGSPLFLENLRELADVLRGQGDIGTGLRLLNEALSLASEHEGTALWYTIIERISWLQYRAGRVSESLQIAQEAIRQIEERSLHLPFTLASLYNTMGGAAWQEANLSEGIAYVEGSLEMYEAEGYAWGTAVACCNLGVLHWTQGNWQDAIAWYERAARIQSENGFPFDEALSLQNLGYLFIALGEVEDAQEYLLRSLQICSSRQHTVGICQSHLALADLAAELQDLPGLTHHLAIAREHSEFADPRKDVEYHLLDAQRLSLVGERSQAIEIACSALELAEREGLQAEIVDAHMHLGIVNRRAANYQEAEKHLRHVLEAADERSAAERKGRARIEMALLFQERAAASADPGHLRNALEHGEHAVRLYEDLRIERRADEARSIVAQTEQMQKSSETRPLPTRTPNHRNLPDVEGEWSQVTILWLRFQIRAEEEDEEEIFSEMAAILSSLSEIVYRQEGEAIRRRDGMTIVFGAPVAQEDDSQRAVSTALAIRDFFSEQSRGSRYSFSMGLASGQAVAGYVDTASRSGFLVTGEPVGTAEKIAEEASAHEIWIDGELAAQIENHFAITPLENIGISWSRVEGAAQDQPRLRGIPGLNTRMIGREQDLLTIEEKHSRMLEGEGGFVWLTGEAGIGKSRLLREYVSKREGEVRIWNGCCTPQGRRQAFSLISDLLANVFAFQSGESTASKRAKLDSALREWFGSLPDIYPYLALLAGLQLHSHHAERLQKLEPDQLRQQIFVACRTLLLNRVDNEPLVIILDDLHWIDPMSASLLLFLSHLTAKNPLLFICAQRPEKNESAEVEMNQLRDLYRHQISSISLARLSVEESQTLLGALLPTADLPKEMQDFILQRSEGNPFYIEEFLRLLIDQDYIVFEDSIWVCSKEKPLRQLPLPNSLEALVRSRVDALPATERQVLQIAAVLGRPFESEIIEKVEYLRELDPILVRLEDRGLLSFDTAIQRWRFNHSLVQLVVYNSMLRVRQKALHLQIAELLEDRQAEDDQSNPEELAHHFSQAGETRRAVRYLVLAGERAAARYANEAALDFFITAREALDLESQTAPIQAIDIDLRWRLYVGLGDVYRFIGLYDESIESLEECLTLAKSETLAPDQVAGIYRRMGQAVQRQGKPEKAYDYYRQALVALEEPEDKAGQIEAARTLHGLTYAHFRRGKLEKALETGQLSRLYAERVGDPNEMAAAENLLGGTYYEMGDWEPALEHTIRAMNLREEVGYTWGVASSLGNLGILTYESGNWKEALDYFRRSLDLRVELGDVEGTIIVNNNLGQINRMLGEWEESEHHYRAALEVAESMRIVFHAASAMLGLGQLHLLRGELEEAAEMLEKSSLSAVKIDAQNLLAEIYCDQARLLLRRGREEEAEECARWAVVLAAETKITAIEAVCWSVVSECLLVQGDYPEALDSIHHARKALSDAGDSIAGGQVAMQYGKLLKLRNDERADLEFDRAEAIFERHGAKHELTQLAKLRHISPKQTPMSL